MSAEPPRPHIDAASVRTTLRQAGLRARRSLSQNFLVDAEVLDAILATAAPRPGRHILEIGPGLGILTGALIEAGATVTAVEVDAGLVRWLEERYAPDLAGAPGTGGVSNGRGSLRLVLGDVLDQDLATLAAPPFDVVANLPYHVTSPILHRLLGGASGPERLVLMVQREVAERIAAPPGGTSYLSVFVQYHAAVRIVRIVPAIAFEPAPKVDSAVLELRPWQPGDRDAPARLDAQGEDALWRVVQAAFRERRKMLHNVLPRQLPVPTARVDAALAETGIAPDRRPQTLSVAEWMDLVEALGSIGPDTRGQRTTEADARQRRRSAGSGSPAADADGPGSSDR
jgi:16S rRNA (adenine1518-N6/adenine1519-N6)-dimethyltransferase